MQKKFMYQALQEAEKAFVLQEVPVGAVLVKNNVVIARGHNLIEQEKNPTKHAEIVCIEKACQIFQDWRLEECTLYVTLEPCPMCLGALIQARVKKVVWGAKDPRGGALGSFCNLIEKPHPIHQIESIGGIFADESKELLQKFFQMRREENKCKKKKSALQLCCMK